MPDAIRATHSILAAAELGSLVASDYAIGDGVSCFLLHRGLNDTYQVDTADSRYILRVYRHGWRTAADIDAELAALEHLRRRSIPAAYAVRRRDGRLHGAIAAPEGDRAIALFEFAPGEPRDKTTDTAALYGSAVARVHQAWDDFVPPTDRRRLDIDHLVHTPARAIGPFLFRRPDDQAYVEHLESRLSGALARLEIEPVTQGFCHGDFHGGNAHYDGDSVTFFDFDCCGLGWPAYDIAVYHWCARLQSNAVVWPHYLAGYEKVRPLSDADRAAIPLFTAVRQLWYMGLHAADADYFGHDTVDTEFLDRQLAFLRACEADIDTGSPASGQ